MSTPCRRDAGAPSVSCEIIERELHNGAWRYYVHYEGTDRRLDDWVSEAQLVRESDLGGGTNVSSTSSGGAGGAAVGLRAGHPDTACGQRLSAGRHAP